MLKAPPMNLTNQAAYLAAEFNVPQDFAAIALSAQLLLMAEGIMSNVVPGVAVTLGLASIMHHVCALAGVSTETAARVATAARAELLADARRCGATSVKA